MQTFLLTFILVLSLLNYNQAQCTLELGQDLKFCTDDSSRLIGQNIQLLGGTPPFSYLWKTNDTVQVGNNAYVYNAAHYLNDPTLASPQIKANTHPSSTLFHLTVTDSFGNSCKDSIQISHLLTSFCLGDCDYYLPFIIPAGDSVSLFSCVQPPYPIQTVSWTPTLGLSNPNVHNPRALPPITTHYQVTITDSAGCAYTSNCSVYNTVSSSKSLPSTNFDVQLSPNPVVSKSILTISLPKPEAYTFLVFDAIGRLHKKQNFSSNTIDINRQEFRKGLWFYQIKHRESIIYQNKFLIE